MMNQQSTHNHPRRIVSGPLSAGLDALAKQSLPATAALEALMKSPSNKRPKLGSHRTANDNDDSPTTAMLSSLATKPSASNNAKGCGAFGAMTDLFSAVADSSDDNNGDFTFPTISFGDDDNLEQDDLGNHSATATKEEDISSFFPSAPSSKCQNDDDPSNFFPVSTIPKSKACNHEDVTSFFPAPFSLKSNHEEKMSRFFPTCSSHSVQDFFSNHLKSSISNESLRRGSLQLLSKNDTTSSSSQQRLVKALPSTKNALRGLLEGSHSSLLGDTTAPYQKHDTNRRVQSQSCLLLGKRSRSGAGLAGGLVRSKTMRADVNNLVALASNGADAIRC